MKIKKKMYLHINIYAQRTSILPSTAVGTVIITAYVSTCNFSKNARHLQKDIPILGGVIERSSQDTASGGLSACVTPKEGKAKASSCGSALINRGNSSGANAHSQLDLLRSSRKGESKRLRRSKEELLHLFHASTHILLHQKINYNNDIVVVVRSDGRAAHAPAAPSASSSGSPSSSSSSAAAAARAAGRCFLRRR